MPLSLYSSSPNGKDIVLFMAIYDLQVPVQLAYMRMQRMRMQRMRVQPDEDATDEDATKVF